ncbi:MAG: hypothetical protein GWN87_14535, partial [Desulfuromonadales bacterium]|nr:hypothetical protein [Desulfuromonadales bacterium]
MRIEMLPARRGPIWMRVLFDILRRRHGKVSPPLRVYGWKPGILRTFLGLGRAVRKSG